MTTSLHSQQHGAGALKAVPHSRLLQSIQTLASIHDGKKGQVIPNEVMAFYWAVNTGDRFRPRMLKVIVPAVRDLMMSGITSRSRLSRLVRQKLGADAERLPRPRLNQWLATDDRRTRYLRPAASVLDTLRAGYVAEGMVIFEDAYDYVEALAAA